MFFTIAAVMTITVWCIISVQAEEKVGGVRKIWNFEDVPDGQIPAGWRVEATHQRGPLATWEVVSDVENGKKTKVLGMTKANHDSSETFNLCWTESVKFKDGEIAVRFKAIKGTEDQGGGPIWRVKDKNNYYVARANPLEGNFRLYYVKNGSRKTLDSASVDIPGRKWHAIRIVHQGDHIEGYLNGKKYLDTKDSTFQEAGGIGLWPLPMPRKFHFTKVLKHRLMSGR